MHPQNWVREQSASIRAREKTHSRDGFRRVYSHQAIHGGGADRSWGSAGTVGLAAQGRSDCRVEPWGEKHGVGLCGGPGQAQVAFTGRGRWNKGTALQLPLLSDPLAGTPPLTKPNQEARGSWVLWTRPMLAGLPGPRARGRRAVSRAGQRTR